MSVHVNKQEIASGESPFLSSLMQPYAVDLSWDGYLN